MRIEFRIVSIILILSLKLMDCFEPLTFLGAGVAAIGGAALTWYNYNLERCNSKWIDNNKSNLRYELNSKVYGQHLATNMVNKLIGEYMSNETPEKALVLSFHGWTGNGKNFVSEIVAKNLFKKYRESGKSDFVHKFLCTHLTYYDKHLIREWIKNITETVKKCHKSLFIFDEIDKLPEGVIDVIKPFVDFNNFVDSVDYRKAIFIFLSNTGGNAINQRAFNFYESGKRREDITWKDMEPLVESGALNENQNGGLHKSDIVAKSLISAFVPFLPLEKKHIRLCIVDYLKNRYNKTNPGYDPGEEFIRDVSNQMEYFPLDIQIYSKTGCKRVQDKVDLLM